MIPITAIYGVEVSGICNFEAKCNWCPMHAKPRNRQRGLIEKRTVDAALKWVSKLEKVDALALHGFGEPLLHPKFDEIAARFAEVTPITMSTNGALLNDRWADRLAKVKWAWISVSPWDPKAAEWAAALLQDRGIEIRRPPGVTHNWANQAEGHNSVFTVRGCPFLNRGHASIRWDGTVSSCCVTDRPEDSLGDIFKDELPMMRAYSLCESCHLSKR